jgi:hemerythrin
MPKLEWSEKYRTGIELIDAQHKQIISRVNSLYEACENMNEREKILELVSTLDFYTDGHFVTEEDYMIRFQYDEYPQHKERHEFFKSIYEEIRRNYIYEKGESVYVMALHLDQAMVDWLDYHLQHEDQRLAEFLRNRLKSG